MKRYIIPFFLILFILQIPGCVYGATVRLTWEANDESDLAGYTVYYGTSSGVYGVPVDVGNVLTHDVTGLTDGTYYFVLTASDLSGNESGFSAEVPVVVDKSSPLSPSGVGAVVL